MDSATWDPEAHTSFSAYDEETVFCAFGNFIMARAQFGSTCTVTHQASINLLNHAEQSITGLSIYWHRKVR